jgi:hypothetical protein
LNTERNTGKASPFGKVIQEGENEEDDGSVFSGGKENKKHSSIKKSPRAIVNKYRDSTVN